MRTSCIVVLAAGVAAATGCGGEPVQEETGVEPAAVGYNPNSLLWLQEGRPVSFDGRAWRPIGRPIYEPSALRQVGEFEGMALYSPIDEESPYDNLFFPFGSNLWQPLEPVERTEPETPRQ